MLIILTKFDEDRAKIVDFLLIVCLWVSVIFFESVFMMSSFGKPAYVPKYPNIWTYFMDVPLDLDYAAPAEKAEDAKTLNPVEEGHEITTKGVK